MGNRTDAPRELSRRTSLGLLLLVMALAVTLRLVGQDWGGPNLLHPDERFISMVTTSLEPNEKLLDYFDTGSSKLNPENTGSHPQFVYGTYPVILVRMLGEAFGQTGLGQVKIMGRLMSTVWDLLTILLVFLIGARLGDRRTGVVAAFFLTVTVLHIQHSHYFTVDLAQVFFVTLALYMAIRIAGACEEPGDESLGSTTRRRLAASHLGLSLLFGIAAGAAVAAKLSAAPVVLLLPAAHLIRLIQTDADRRRREVLPVLVTLVATGLVFGLTFRVLQPYAFAGPGFFDLGLNPRWMNAIESLRNLTGPGADWPPAMQWARRSAFFSGRNLVLWGFGLPLGLLVFAGLASAIRQSIRRGAGPLTLAAGWAFFYFVWQSLGDNPMMRYQLPIYPILVVFAAWLLTSPWRSDGPDDDRSDRRHLAAVVGAVVGLASLVYAIAFVGIYVRPITREAASRWLLSEVPGPVNLVIDTGDGTASQPVSIPYDRHIVGGRIFETRTRGIISGTIRSLELPHVIAGSNRPDSSFGIDPPVLSAVVLIEGGGEAAAAGTCSAAAAPEEFRCTLELELGLVVEKNDQLTIRFDLAAEPDQWVLFEGGAIANEASWDDGLPLRLDGYDPYGGIYQRDLNLHQTDYIAISSNRQWGTLPRISERFPLVTTYYRHLIGCPPERSVAACFIGAEAGETEGDLGFELVATFSSPPTLGPLVINDQWAEEAFTVYDHPKALIFRKTDAYNPTHVREIFESVDLDRVLRKAPGHFGHQPADLMLPAHRFQRQQQGGTWRERFPPDALVNRRPFVAAVAWYLALAVLGLGVAPLVRWAFPGLADGGLPLARGFGLLLLAWIFWIIGSTGISVGPGTVRLVALVLITAGAVVAWRRSAEHQEHHTGFGRRLLTTEVVFGIFFLICLAVRALNPDLWHPSYGGEKPMDLSYFTAVLKSVNFPPYDPWFAGGYLNYYYFGFVIVGQLALALGIQPAIAYNLALPTLIALAAVAAFSIATNIVRAGGDPPGVGERRRLRPELAGLIAATAVTLFGNLHPVRMFFTGLYELGEQTGRGVMVAVAAGFTRLVAGDPLPIARHHWFWNPTRIIPDPDVMPITEFPAFTFIYGDLHAHLMDLPQVLLAMAFALAVLVGWNVEAGRGRRFAAIFLGALAVGAMRPTNTWSYYPFLALGFIAVALARTQIADQLPKNVRFFRTMMWAVGFALLTRVLYLPYDAWFGMGYSELQYWNQSRTPMLIYLEHWAPFLFPVATWLVLEMRDWLAATPLSAVRPLKRHLWPMVTLGVPAVAGQALLIILGVRISWLVWPLLVIAGLLLLRRDLPAGRLFALLIAGLGLSLTIVVELVTLKFDLGRMNTVFKFYYVAWALLAVSAAAGLWWRAARRPKHPSWSYRGWWLVAMALLIGASIFPLRAIPAKTAERMAREAPRGLDGLAYLEYATHHDQGRPLILAEDLAAIRWLQRNVDGSPVIVEANIPEYRWGSRITINTGLPGVVGWNWHQRQQRAFATDRWVWDRVHAIGDFYTTDDREEVESFLARYDVRWVVVGQLERAYYPGDGLSKFNAWEGDLWREAFRDGETAIYEVMR